jgi:voltage-gated potassium channel
MMEQNRKGELKNINYEIFILALSLLSIFNWALIFILSDEEVLSVLFLVDLLLTVIFISDFLYRFATADSKREYFLRQFGWLDLLSSFPFVQAKIARLGRIFRTVRLMRRSGFRPLMDGFFRDRAGSAVYLVAILIVLVLEFGSVAILSVESTGSNPNITTAGDAVWWSIVTMSTVGYGDLFPVTAQGRLVAIFVIILGVALFGVVTGFLANRFVPDDDDDGPEPSPRPALNPEDLNAILAEIASLRAEQEQAYANFDAKLEKLFHRLPDKESTE